MISDLRELPAVAAYLNRIGAEVRSLWTAHVREREGRYWREVAVIRFDKDGKITAPDEHAAKASEQAQIVDAFTGASFPELRFCATIRNAPPSISEAAADNVFEFRDEHGNIIMLQLRCEKDRRKSYIPYTYWTDDAWRAIEPEGLLPLWGTDQLKQCATVFVHEGAKAARAVRRMVESATPQATEALAAHPWGRELSHAAHVGWIGGALSPHRTDWSPLRKFGVERVIIVADNDDPGNAAVPKIARELRTFPIHIEALRFDDRWPVAFDLADPFPDSMFSETNDSLRRYRGPSYDDCLTPATWATRAHSSPPRAAPGRPPAPSYSLRSEFTGDWWMVAGENEQTFIPRRDPTRRYSVKGFDGLARPLSDHPRPSELFQRDAYGSIVRDLTYSPGDAAGVINVSGVLSVNMWVPSRIRPTKGDTGPWEQFLAHLIPSADERGHVERWLATLIACPGVRMKYGLLLASTAQGVGKTTLCEIMRVLVGERNSSNPIAQQIINSSFNSWIGGKRLIYVNEIYEDKSWTAYNKLKTYVTDPSIRVNEKFLPEYTVPNWAHFILCSNSELALRLEDQDRRFLVPTVTEMKRPTTEPTFWPNLYSWLEGGGYGVIAHWADAFVKEHGAVGPGNDAPMTGRKRQLIEDSRSPNERMVLDLAEAALARADDTGLPVVLVDFDVAAWLPQQPGKAIPLHLIRGWLRAGKLHIGKDRPKFNGHKRQVASTADMDGKSLAELREYVVTPQTLIERDM